MHANHRINVIIDQKIASPGKESLIRVAAQTLRAEGIRNDIAMNLLLTDDARIKILNRQFLGRNESTDVISFGAKKMHSPNKKLKGFIGEIVISTQMAEYNARRFDTTFQKEIFLYVIHGILHLLGYGDKTKKEKSIIQEKQTKIFEAICGQLNS